MFNFQSGTELAIFQDQLIAKYNNGDLKLNASDIDKLYHNTWVDMATVMAPCNLVIRHLCLQDLFAKGRYNESKILSQINIIGKNDIWIEGYSYWEYSLMMLRPYARDLGSNSIGLKIASINSFFSLTSYIGPDGKKWPAPFGDLRKGPLSDQFGGISMTYRVDFFTKNEAVYTIQDRNLGMNTHTPRKSVLTIRNGVPMDSKGVEFHWYDGYDKKYPNKLAEILDTISLKRLFSIFRR